MLLGEVVRKLNLIVLGVIASIGLATGPILLFTFIEAIRIQELACSFKRSIFWLRPFFPVCAIVGALSLIYHITVFLDRKTLKLWNKLFILLGFLFIFFSVSFFFIDVPCSIK